MQQSNVLVSGLLIDTLFSVCMTTKTVNLFIRQVSRTDGFVNVTDLSELQKSLALTVFFSVTSRIRWPPNDPCNVVGVGAPLALGWEVAVASLRTAPPSTGLLLLPLYVGDRLWYRLLVCCRFVCVCS